jgi:trehalose 6-phosphate synthase
MVSNTNPASEDGANRDGSMNAPRHLVFVSNRGPVEHYFDEAGKLQKRNAAGGIATALGCAAHQQRVTWIAAACSAADRSVASTHGCYEPFGPLSRSRLVDIPPEVYAPYYLSFCNPILWFVQHSLIGSLLPSRLSTEAIESWHRGYVPANRAFAEAAVDEVPGDGSGSEVMLHDYHLYLAPREIRQARPNVAMQHFLHIPWPGPSAWLWMPGSIVRQICLGLLACDSIVFQTQESADNFLATCRVYLPEAATVRYSDDVVVTQGHETSVWAHPISVDSVEVESAKSEMRFSELRRHLEAKPGVKTIVRVDRLDPSKNIERGFLAFERLLERRPALRSRVRFLAFLIPSRSEVQEYSEYGQRAFAVVDRINAKFGTDEFTPVSVFHQNDRLHAFAGLALYDVLLANSVADGMNLVSKEGPLLNERDGVLVLSRRAGSYEQLGAGAIGVDPLDVDATAQAMLNALLMRETERRRRSELLRKSISLHQLNDWLRLLLKDLEHSTYRRSSSREPVAVS